MTDDQHLNMTSDSIIRSRLGSDRADRLIALMTREINPSSLTSLLLVVYDLIVKQRSAKDVFRQYNQDSTLQPSSVSQRDLVALDGLLLDATIDSFDAVELSPVAPLGINTVLAHTSQKNVLSTIRNIEVVADVTSSLAIECAKRRKAHLIDDSRSVCEVNLCGSQRSIRLQNFDDIPGFTSHFRLFGAASANRDIGSEKFESDNLVRHVRSYLDFLSVAEQSGYPSEEVVVVISDIRIAERVIDRTTLTRDTVTKNTQNPDFNLFSCCNVDIPTTLQSTTDIPSSFVSEFGLEKSLSYLQQIEDKAVNIIRQRYPSTRIVFDLARIAGIGYYESLCFKILAHTTGGSTFPLADGGLTDWTKKLLNNKKERLFISGFGTELFCRNYVATAD